MTLQERVIKLADEIGSLTDLASAVGVTYSTAHNWKKGKNEPQGGTLARFEAVEKKYFNMGEMFWRETPNMPDQAGEYLVWVERDGGFWDKDKWDGQGFVQFGQWVTFWSFIVNPRTGEVV